MFHQGADAQELAGGLEACERLELRFASRQTALIHLGRVEQQAVDFREGGFVLLEPCA